jgi:hypothetical protein
MECDTKEHWFYALTVGLPFLSIFSVFIPGIFFGLLLKNRNRLRDEFVLLKYGYLYSEYKPQHFYWEFVKMYARII